jgi:hypothetical protein
LCLGGILSALSASGSIHQLENAMADAVREDVGRRWSIRAGWLRPKKDLTFHLAGTLAAAFLLFSQVGSICRDDKIGDVINVGLARIRLIKTSRIGRRSVSC